MWPTWSEVVVGYCFGMIKKGVPQYIWTRAQSDHLSSVVWLCGDAPGISAVNYLIS